MILANSTRKRRCSIWSNMPDNVLSALYRNSICRLTPPRGSSVILTWRVRRSRRITWKTPGVWWMPRWMWHARKPMIFSIDSFRKSFSYFRIRTFISVVTNVNLMSGCNQSKSRHSSTRNTWMIIKGYKPILPDEWKRCWRNIIVSPSIGFDWKAFFTDWEKQDQFDDCIPLLQVPWWVGMRSVNRDSLHDDHSIVAG